MEPITQLTAHLSNPKLKAVLEIQSQVLFSISKFFRNQGFLELPPVILSPITDPLAHGVHEASIDYEGQQLQLTKSMIFHKQLALSKLIDLEKIFIISPNVRLEKSSEAKERHLIEFHQIDFEIKGVGKEYVYALMEKLLSIIITDCKKNCSHALDLLERTLPDLQEPFERIKTYEAEKEYGKDYEKILSEKKEKPFWLESFYREFYDKEDSKISGRFDNYDLIYPEGFEEGLSGGEREYKKDIIVKKMKERKMDFKPYDVYLDIVGQDLLEKTAGGGFGLQRLLRYLTGIREIEKVVLFPRSPRGQIWF